ncbi:hypothetical protein M513_13864 [Trichuris suis]|uniref:Uncharacterized protein n=1 Tax=Trichuris suis TaxID=68888 RepID=A0A085LJW3_9BILA|nr:hypothetical protein M513_13864 [Trichuris suis]
MSPCSLEKRRSQKHSFLPCGSHGGIWSKQIPSTRFSYNAAFCEHGTLRHVRQQYRRGLAVFIEFG